MFERNPVPSLSGCSSAILMACALFAVGCSGSADTTKPAASPAAPTAAASAPADDASGSTAAAPKKTYRPVRLGGGGAGDSGSTTGVVGIGGAGSSAPPKFEDVKNALKPVQIVLGEWDGIATKSASNEVHDWVWDLKSDPVFPALVLKTQTGAFFSSMRLTYDPRIAKFLMTSVDNEKIERKFEGEWQVEPQDVPSEDGKTTHRTFKLELTQVAGGEGQPRFKFVINQQNNNRYLLEVHRARGTAAFRQVDVIGSQRDGVSFAQSDSDYGDRACIISEGLGTMQVSYQGKSYYVCCTGCKAAFEEDPALWLARLEERKKMKE